MAALVPGIMSAFFSFGGWWDVSKVAGEVRDPERNMPRALALGVAVVTVVFVLVSGVFLYLVPLDRVASDDAFAKLAGEALFGPSGGEVFSGIVIVVVLGSLCSVLMAQPRVYFAMARDGLFLKALGPRSIRALGTPMRAIALQAALASALVILGERAATSARAHSRILSLHDRATHRTQAWRRSSSCAASRRRTSGSRGRAIRGRPRSTSSVRPCCWC